MFFVLQRRKGTENNAPIFHCFLCIFLTKRRVESVAMSPFPCIGKSSNFAFMEPYDGLLSAFAKLYTTPHHITTKTRNAAIIERKSKLLCGSRIFSSLFSSRLIILFVLRFTFPRLIIRADYTFESHVSPQLHGWKYYVCIFKTSKWRFSMTRQHMSVETLGMF